MRHTSFTAFLLLGTLLMAAVMLYAGGARSIPAWKRLAAAVILAVAGLAGAKLMAYIESGSFSGRSFFGAVFFVPLILWPTALALRIPPKDMLDISAPAECVMLALLKVDCAIEGCCRGRELGIAQDGTILRFPSQITECVAAMVLMLVLLWFLQRETSRGKIYFWYLVLYGATRFVLNLFRETEPFVWGLSAGNFWALIALLLGGAGLWWFHRLERRRAVDDEIQ